MTKYAAIGTDGTREVVWGLGDTEEAAMLDAAAQDEAAGVDLRAEQISEAQAAVVEAGDVSWPVVVR